MTKVVGVQVPSPAPGLGFNILTREENEGYRTKSRRPEEKISGGYRKQGFWSKSGKETERNRQKRQVAGFPSGQSAERNVETKISISIYDAFFGAEKKISLKTVNGNMKSYTIKVPKGIREGEKIRLIGQGKPGENGYDIYTDLLLTPWEAALGTRVDVQAIDGETKVYIPQGVKSSELIRIPNKGYYNGNGGRGDLVAEIKVMVPDKLTDEEKNLYKKLKEISKFNPRNNNLHK